MNFHSFDCREFENSVICCVSADECWLERKLLNLSYLNQTWKLGSRLMLVGLICQKSRVSITAEHTMLDDFCNWIIIYTVFSYLSVLFLFTCCDANASTIMQIPHSAACNHTIIWHHWFFRIFIERAIMHSFFSAVMLYCHADHIFQMPSLHFSVWFIFVH